MHKSRWYQKKEKSIDCIWAREKITLKINDIYIFLFWPLYMCQGVSITVNHTHQITITRVLITATCHHSARALYPPAQNLSGIKHRPCTNLTLSCYTYLSVSPAISSPSSSAPVLHHLLVLQISVGFKEEK